MNSCYHPTKEFIEDEILCRTSQMKSLCNDAEQAGCQTIIDLAEQGEQLTNIHRHLTSIDQQLDEGKYCRRFLKKLTQRTRQFLRRSNIEESKNLREPTNFAPSSSKSDDDLDQMISRLRVLAEDMNDELNRQNVQLGQIHRHVLQSKKNLNERNVEMEKILYK